MIGSSLRTFINNKMNLESQLNNVGGYIYKFQGKHVYCCIPLTYTMLWMYNIIETLLKKTEKLIYFLYQLWLIIQFEIMWLGIQYMHYLRPFLFYFCGWVFFALFKFFFCLFFFISKTVLCYVLFIQYSYMFKNISSFGYNLYLK